MTAPKGLLLVVAIVAARPLTRAVASSELHRAVLAGNAVEVAALLAEGADVNARDRRDQTPLFLVTASSSSDRRVEMCAGRGRDATESGKSNWL